MVGGEELAFVQSHTEDEEKIQLMHLLSRAYWNYNILPILCQCGMLILTSLSNAAAGCHHLTFLHL